MRAVMLEVDQRMLAERSRLGLDKLDEMWEGELHMVPPPYERHGYMQGELLAVLAAIGRNAGLRAGVGVGVFAAADDYRIPDIAVYARSEMSERGIEGAAALVVEVCSPGDESTAKIPWYLARGVGCVLIVDRDTLALEAHTAAGQVAPDEEGFLDLAPLAARIGPGGRPEALVVIGDGLRFETDLS